MNSKLAPAKTYCNAAYYEEFCPHCDATIGYEEIYTNNKVMTDEDFKPFDCPVCGASLWPCDFCHNEYGGCGSIDCPFEAEKVKDEAVIAEQRLMSLARIMFWGLFAALILSLIVIGSGVI